MVHNPIKLQNNLNLYSGDVITINNSNPLLVEVITDQTVKLRNIKDDKYLSKNFFLPGLDFSTDFENALTFAVEENSDGEMSFKTDDNKYLKSKNKGFSLSPKERLLTIAKQQDIENIDDYKETIEETKLHKKEKLSDEEVLIASKVYDNNRDNPFKYNFKFSESKQNEHNFTWSKEFTWGASAKLNSTFSSIVGAEIGGQFERKTGTSNSITKTETKTIEESLEIDCLPWKKTKVKLLARKVKTLTPYTAKVKRVIGGRNYEYLIDGEYSGDSYSESRCLTEDIAARNILLVGCTGSGKSTLAKVLSGDNRFEEGSGSVSKTKFFKKSKEFKWKENDYYVIDNIGFGDTETTKISEKEELIRIGEAINSAYQGLSQVLFVFGGRFSDKEKEGFQKLAALKFTNSLITLVRSKFDNFYDEDECKKDEDSLRTESSEISKLFDNCRGILHVDNSDEDSRDESREIVLDYLNNNCADDPFKPKEWEDISSLIEDYLQNKEKLVNEKNQADTAQKEVIEQKISNLKTDTADQIREKVKEGEIREFMQVIEVANK